jgi:hypothetical protein
MDNTITHIGHEQTENRTNLQTRPTPPPLTQPNKATDKVKNYEHKLILHYIHEKRFQSFKHDIHKLYKDIFGDPSAMNVKIIVANRNRRSATHELIRKRPKKALLQDRPIKSEYIQADEHTIFLKH